MKYTQTLLFLMLCIGCVFLFVACGPMQQAAKPTILDALETTFTDALGRELSIQPPLRVAALGTSLADLWQLAGGEVAVTTRDALEDPALQFPAEPEDCGSLKSPDLETLIAAGVDLVLLSSTISGQVELAQTLDSMGIANIAFNIETFDDYLTAMQLCTELTGRADLYQEHAEAVREQIDTVVARCQSLDRHPTVLLIRAASTGAKARGSNNMTGTMLRELGCVNLADRDQSLLESLSMEQILLDDPDFIFVTTMGAEDTALEVLAQALLDDPAWATLSAVREGRYHVLPSALFHNKPNARWAESYTMLADLLYGKP